MGKTFKRTLATIMVVLMVITSAPLGGFVGINFKAEAATVTSYSQGDIIEFGWYPQSKVTDSATISALNSAGGEWASYNYYSGTGYGSDGKMTASDYMRYKDVIYGSNKYRGVVFDSYRPYYTGYTSSASNPYQYNNGYSTKTVYWFKYEPIKWRVLDPATGMVMSETILDSQPYNNYILSSGKDEYGKTAYWGDSTKTYYANNYAESSIRQWLNNDFYNTAFSKAQQNIIKSTTLDNSAYSSSYPAYDSASTSDKIYLLSWKDSINTSYGFSSNYSDYDADRRAKGSAYAKSQGLWVSSGSYYGNSYWLLRSPGYYSISCCRVGGDGYSSYIYYVYYTYYGIRPALNFNLTSEIFQSDVKDTGNASGNGAGTGDVNQEITDGYKLRLRSDGAYSDSIAIGKEITFWTFLYNNGERENCNRAYAISFDTPGIFEVVKTKKTSSSFDVTLKACKAGTTNMTVSDSKTGAYVTIRLKANNPVEVITMDEVQKLAKEYQKDKLTHFYDYNGLYVDGYSYSKIKDGSYNVSMNVYNEKAHHGAVVSYDKNGNIADYELINPQDKLPTSLWDGLFDGFDLLNDLIAKYKDKYLYDEESFTKRTRIDDLNVSDDEFIVPDGGYFVITNNYLENEYVFFANTINIAIDLICAYSKVNKVDVPDELPEKATEKVIEKILKDLGPDQFKAVFKKLVKNFAKDLTISNVDVFMSGMVSTFKEFEINIEEIIKDTLEDLMTDTESHLDFAEDMVLTLFGADAIKTALSSLGYINTAIKLIDVFSSSLAPKIAIYTPAEDGTTIRTSNGVSVTSETPLASDYVLHSYVINDTSDVMTEAKPTLDALKSNYQICDITLYKSSQAVQPDAKITVMIPIPEGYNKKNIQVFWYKDDGTLQSMNAVVKGDYAVFETDHLSYYVLVEDHKCNYEESITAATCTKAGKKTYTCVCGDTYTETIAKLGHKYDNACDKECNRCKATRSITHSYKTTTTKATLKKNGKVINKCSVCGYSKKTTVYYPKSIKLSATSYTYNGKVKTPSVTVKDSKGKKLKNGTDYTVKYSKGRKSIGKYTVTVTFKGNYSGTKKLTFEIVPAKVTLSKLTAGSKALTATWKTVSGATGYEVQYSTSKKFTKKTTKNVNIKKAKTKKTTINKLKKGKKYYVRIRAYKTVNKKPVYGAWSSVKSIKVK